MKPVCIVLLLVFSIAVSYAQPDKNTTQTFHFVFSNTVADSVLQTNSTYQNQFGEMFTVRSFKYYISHVQLVYENGKSYAVKATPHLVSETDSASKLLSFTAPSGTIINIQFLLGIDSVTNTSGVQTGDLDPAKGMFWIWNTGYIMAKLEGSSPASKAPAKQYSYDIGGYKAGENAARKIILTVPPNNSKQPSTFIIAADISKWFFGKSSIRIAEHPMCHSPGTLAMQMADNYADMFRISSVR